MLSRLRIERQKRDGGDYGGAEEDGEHFDDNDDSNLGDDGNDDDFNWPAADVSATGANFVLPRAWFNRKNILTKIET